MNKPGVYPADDFVQAFTLLMSIIGLFALLLSAFLVINTISALLTQQIRQIGVMKSIGARSRDIAQLYEDLTELSVVRVRESNTVTITFDAIPGFELHGTVPEIKPLGQNRQGDIVYTVVVKPTSWDERLRWNMTASIHIDSTVASN
jgi:hypothetical protein